MCAHHPLHCILPPRILHRVAESGDDEVRAAALQTLALDHKFRIARAESAARQGGRSVQPVTFARLGGKALFAGFLATLLNAAVAGALLSDIP